MACSSAFALTGTITSEASDAQANSDGTVTNQTITFGRLGADSGIRHSVIHVFKIPSAVLSDPTQQFSAVTYKVRTGLGSTMTANGDLYGVGYDVVSTVSAADFYEGALDPTPGNTLIKDNFLVPSTPAYTDITNSDTALVTYLNACLATARADGASDAYVFLRINLDAYSWSGVYLVGMAEAVSPYPPTLAYTTVTVPAWTQIPLGGGGYVTGLIGDSTGSTLLARTDVGGIYKWNAVGENWLNLTDKIVPTTTRWNSVEGLLKTMSAAIDPTNSSNLYIAVGNSSGVSSSNAGIYASANGGSTWSEITTGTPNFSINGNGDRAGGERLAVDPNNPNLLWYGSETAGLIKGVKSGSLWTWSQVSSAEVPLGTFEPDPNSKPKGVRFVVCDKNGAATITYAGVYDYSGSTGGVYKTTDGVNWDKIPGITLAKPARATVASDGTLYVTGTGGVFKMTRAGTVTTITPGSASLAYRALAISPDGSVVTVANVSDGTCEIWRSTSGGAAGTWKTQGTASFNNLNNSAARINQSEPDGSPTIGYQWFGNLAALWINPTNVNELWGCDYYGVQRTSQADRIGNTAVNTQPVWYRLLKNLEETVVFSVRNAPTGNRLLAGVADVGGFRYANNVAQGPFSAYSNGGGLNATYSKNVTSIDFSEGNPSHWVYAWAMDGTSFGTGGVSTDGGNTWRRFGQLARRNIPNSTTAGWEIFDLGSYLAKQRAKGVTTVTLVVAGGDPWWENTPSMSFGSRESANAPRLVVNGSTVLPILADTYVSRPAPTTNYGNSTSLAIRNNYDTEAWSYIKFDLSGVATIADSRLELYRNSSANNTSTLDVGVHIGASNSWIEGNGGSDNSPVGEMTYNNRAYTITDSSAANSPLSSQPDYRQGGVSLRAGRIAISSSNPDVMVWLPIGQTARYSEDGGMTWSASTGAPASQIAGLYTIGANLDKAGINLAADRVNGHFYIATFETDAHKIYRSIDGGKTWSPRTNVSNGGTHNMRTPQIVAAPASSQDPDGGDIWVCDDSTYNNNPFPVGGLWRSTDGGGTWTKINTIGRVSQVSFGKHPSGTGYTIYAHGESNPGGLRKVYRNDNYGTTSWTAMADLPSDIPILSISGDRQNSGKVFIGTDGRGMFIGQ
ncbi:MAG: hypothetical protein K0R17_3070 [Rariglobus sp.]|jgi:hypothetical protein|nr:hypothetical protein [Rariglobus sp.]